MANSMASHQTTGSMASYIDAEKELNGAIVRDIKVVFPNEAEVRVAVAVYKDHIDSPNIQFLDFSPSADSVHEFLDSWSPSGEVICPKACMEVSTNRLEIAKALIQYGVDMGVKTDGFYCTCLAAASAYGHLDMVKLLLDNGATVNKVLPPDELVEWRRVNYFMFRNDRKRSGCHGSAPQAAAFVGHLEVSRFPERREILRFLVQAVVDVNREGGEFGYPVIGAAAGRNVEAPEALVAAGARVNAVAARIRPALTATMVTNDISIIATSQPRIPWKPGLAPDLDDFVRFRQNPRSLLSSQSKAAYGSHIFGQYVDAVARQIFLSRILACVESLLPGGADPNVSGGL
ncbi:hypothetical protein GQ53DRAFT_763900 [Thozetella sp. PMI_491]|nr:hypothetical protein GQ53DRAFT_763900 [Thozetella sp. PMI_491]